VSASIASPKEPFAALIRVQVPPSIRFSADATPVGSKAAAVTVTKASGGTRRGVGTTTPTRGAAWVRLATARPAFTIPEPQPREAHPSAVGSGPTDDAVPSRIRAIMSGVRPGFAAATSAAATATCGVAIDVPSYEA
jgi:hypothetical protein